MIIADWLPILQIRIVKDTQDHEGEGDGTKKKKKKKPHRGYAFIVYEREKDMKGTAFPINTADRMNIPLLEVTFLVLVHG